MAQPLSLTSGRTALLVMDYQNELVQGIPSREALLGRAAAAVQAARQAGVPVIYAVVRFDPGYPEVSRRNKAFTAVKAAGRLVAGTPGAQIHPDLAPAPGDLTVVKRRISAFAGSRLSTVLSALEVETLVLMGIATSGVVLSTACEAADRDFRLVVLADCCGDRDEEVHRLLVDKVLTRYGAVVPAEAFLAALACA